MRISDWSSDVCSSDLLVVEQAGVEIIFADALKRQASEPVVAADFGIGIGEVARDAEAGQSTGQEIEEGLTADFDTFELRLTHVERTVDIISAAVDEFERRGADNAFGGYVKIDRPDHHTTLPKIL